MSVKVDGPRARRKAETRAALKAAARSCFSELGYGATQVGDIARRANVAHGTFYVHFQTKEQLTDELVVEFNQALRERLERTWKKHESEPPAAQIRELAETCLEHWTRERELLVAFAERAASSGSLDTLREGVSPPVVGFVVERVAALGPLDADVDFELVAHALLGMWLRVGLRYVFGPRIGKRAAAELLAKLTLGALSGVVPALTDSIRGGVS